MQYGTFACFDEPLTQTEINFIQKFNALFTNAKLIYKPFNPDNNPDLPNHNYSLGVKIELPSIPDDVSPTIKRVAKRLGIL